MPKKAISILNKAIKAYKWPLEVQLVLLSGYLVKANPSLDPDKFADSTAIYLKESSLSIDVFINFLCYWIDKSDGNFAEYIQTVIEELNNQDNQSTKDKPVKKKKVKKKSSETVINEENQQATYCGNCNQNRELAEETEKIDNELADTKKYHYVDLVLEEIDYNDLDRILKESFDPGDLLPGSIIQHYEVSDPLFRNITFNLDVVYSEDCSLTLDPYMTHRDKLVKQLNPRKYLSPTYRILYGEFCYRISIPQLTVTNN